MHYLSKFREPIIAIFSPCSFSAACVCIGWRSPHYYSKKSKHSVELKATVRGMRFGYIWQVDVTENDCKCNGNAMHCKVRFFRIPCRKKVFIFGNAAYECLSPEEVWQLCSPWLHLIPVFIFCCCYRGAKAEHLVQMPFSAIHKKDLNYVKKRFQRKMVERSCAPCNSSHLYPVRMLEGETRC